MDSAQAKEKVCVSRCSVPGCVTDGRRRGLKHRERVVHAGLPGRGRGRGLSPNPLAARRAVLFRSRLISSRSLLLNGRAYVTDISVPISSSCKTSVRHVRLPRAFPIDIRFRDIHITGPPDQEACKAPDRSARLV